MGNSSLEHRESPSKCLLNPPSCVEPGIGDFVASRQLSVPRCSLQLLPALTTQRGLSTSCFDSLRLFRFFLRLRVVVRAGHCTLVVCTIVVGLITCSNEEDAFYILFITHWLKCPGRSLRWNLNALMASVTLLI